MQGLETIKNKDLENVINDNNFHKKPFIFWNIQEIEDLQNPLHVLTVLKETPTGWKEIWPFYTFHPFNSSEFKAFKSWAIKQVNSLKKHENEIGFAITHQDGDLVTVQAYVN